MNIPFSTYQQAADSLAAILGLSPTAVLEVRITANEVRFTHLAEVGDTVTANTFVTDGIIYETVTCVVTP